MTIEIDPTYIAVALVILIIGSQQVNKQGGPKIVLWRLLGIRWFMRVERQPDGGAIRQSFRWKGTVKTHSLPSYSANGKDWFVGGPKETVRVCGGPQWVYNYNDARPLPLEHGGDPIDPTLIHSAFENKSIEAFNKLNEKPQKFKWGMMALAIVLTLIFAGLSVYYTYYFGYNINCALHTAACR
jgi:hypothetical protein